MNHNTIAVDVLFRCFLSDLIARVVHGEVFAEVIFDSIRQKYI